MRHTVIASFAPSEGTDSGGTHSILSGIRIRFAYSRAVEFDDCSHYGGICNEKEISNKLIIK